MSPAQHAVRGSHGQGALCVLRHAQGTHQGKHRKERERERERKKVKEKESEREKGGETYQKVMVGGRLK